MAALRRQRSLELKIASAQPPVSGRRRLRRPGSRQPRRRANDRPGLPRDLDLVGNHDDTKGLAGRSTAPRRGGDRTRERTGPPSDVGPSRRLAGPSGGCSTAEPKPRLSRRSTRLASRGGHRGRAESRRTLQSDSGRPAPRPCQRRSSTCALSSRARRSTSSQSCPRSAHQSTSPRRSYGWRRSSRPMRRRA